MTTTYKDFPVHVIHVTDIVQGSCVSTMALIYFYGETLDDAYYVPAEEVSNLYAHKAN